MSKKFFTAVSSSSVIPVKEKPDSPLGSDTATWGSPCSSTLFMMRRKLRLWTVATQMASSGCFPW